MLNRFLRHLFYLIEWEIPSRIECTNPILLGQHCVTSTHQCLRKYAPCNKTSATFAGQSNVRPWWNERYCVGETCISHVCTSVYMDVCVWRTVLKGKLWNENQQQNVPFPCSNAYHPCAFLCAVWLLIVSTNSLALYNWPRLACWNRMNTSHWHGLRPTAAWCLLPSAAHASPHLPPRRVHIGGGHGGGGQHGQPHGHQGRQTGHPRHADSAIVKCRV